MAADPTQHIQFIDQQEQEFYAEAMLNEDVRQFLLSDTGKYLHGRAKLVHADCVEQLFKLDPYTPKGKREYELLRREAWCSGNFMKWLADAIINGEQAATRLGTYRQEIGEE